MAPGHRCAAGVLLALVLLPIARPLRAPDSRAWQTLLFLTGLYAISVLATPRWYPGFIVGTVFLTLAIVWAPTALTMLRGRRQVSHGIVAADDLTPDGDATLIAAVRQLPPKQRTAVVQRYLLDRPYAEVATVVGCSEDAARQNVRAGLQRLRDELATEVTA